MCVARVLANWRGPHGRIWRLVHANAVRMLHVSDNRASLRCPCLPPGPKEKLDSTAVSQPAIYVASLAALEKLKAEQVHRRCTASSL